MCNTITLKAFHFILKFEELQKEEEQFLSHCHWDEKINTRSKLNVNNPDNWSRKELTRIYFSTLSQEQIFGLYKVYELDFLLFNYTFAIGDLSLPVLKS